MKRLRVVLLAMLVLLLGAVALSFAQANVSEEEEITGNFVVRQGQQGEVSGVLKLEKGEWYLIVGSRVYELHLGMFGHDGVTTQGLKDGSGALVKGFIYGDHVSPILIESEGITYSFRAEDGRPLWAGRGNNAASTLPEEAKRNEGYLWGRNSGI